MDNNNSTQELHSPFSSATPTKEEYNNNQQQDNNDNISIFVNSSRDKQESNNNRLKAIDGIRFIFAVFIVIGHYHSFLYTNYPSITTLFTRGSTAVDMFFMLSGFIIYIVYENRDFTSWKEIYTFWFYQVSRIGPGYLLALLLNIYKLNITWTSDMSFFHKFIGTILTLIGQQSWLPETTLFCWNMFSWSITCFSFAWFLFPWTKRMVKKSSTIYTDLFYLILFYLFSFGPHLFYYKFIGESSASVDMIYEGDFNIVKTSYWYTVLHSHPIFRISGYIMGMYVAKIYTRKINLKYIGLLTDMSFIFVLVVCGGVPRYVSQWYRDGYELLFCTGFAPFYAIILLGISYEKGLLASLLKTDTLSNLGKISFSIYIYQSLGYFLLGYLGGIYALDSMPILTMTILIFSLIILALISSVFYEIPLQNYLRRKWKENVINRYFTL
ncbi:hypothetical protein ABK040_008118 [Willaertia magna]